MSTASCATVCTATLVTAWCSLNIGVVANANFFPCRAGTCMASMWGVKYPALACAILPECYGLHMVHLCMCGGSFCSDLLVNLQFYHDNGVSNCQGLFFLISYFSVLSSDLAWTMDTLIAQSYFWDPSEFHFFTFNVNCDMNCFLLIFYLSSIFFALYIWRGLNLVAETCYIFLYIFIHLHIYMRRSVFVHVSSLNNFN